MFYLQAIVNASEYNKRMKIYLSADCTFQYLSYSGLTDDGTLEQMDVVFVKFSYTNGNPTSTIEVFGNMRNKIQRQFLPHPIG